MLSAKDLARFIFQHADNEQKSYLRNDQFNILMHQLAEGGPFNARLWTLEYERFHGELYDMMYNTQRCLSLLC